MSNLNENKEMDTGKKIFSDEDWDKIAKYMVGNTYKYRENIIIPKNIGPIQIKSKEEKMVEAAFESCAFKSLMSCVMGK